MMKLTNHKNRRGTVLAVSCVLAGIIMGSSTFAWFTSADEVINRLSSEGKYDVVVVEDFTPPIGWVPGQEVEKHVRATNTGNIDAFVKMSIQGDMVLTKRDTSLALTASNKAAVLEKAMKLTNADEGIRSKMAGSRLVYKAGATASDGYTYDEAAVQGAGVVVDVEHSEFVTVDSGGGAAEFTPTATGYYIFARSTTQNSSDGTAVSVVYDGYYYDAGTGTYYDAEITASDSNVFLVTAKIRQKKTVAVSNDQFLYEWAKENPSDTGNTMLRVTYSGDIGEEDDIVIDIKLTNLSDWTQNLEDGSKTAAFYYNKILRAGATTSNVMESVLLNESVRRDAFYTMNYNLRVSVNSAQIVDGERVEEAVNAQEWTNAAGKKIVTAVNTVTGAVTWSDRA